MARCVNSEVLLPTILRRGTHRNTLSLQRARELLVYSRAEGKRWKQITPLIHTRTGRSSPCLTTQGLLAAEDKHTYEEDIARRWWALPLRINLPLSNGESCQLLYAGRPGSSPGPDIRDAILSFTSCHSETGYTVANIQQTAENAVGDVEIHTRAIRHRAVLPGALGTLLEKPLATAREWD